MNGSDDAGTDDLPELSTIDRVTTAELIEALPDAAFVTDADGVIVAINRAGEDLSGWPAAAAVGKHIRVVAPPERRAEQDAAFAWVRSTGNRFTYEAVRRRADGEPVTVEVISTPLRDGDAIVGVLSVARPVRADAAASTAGSDHLVAELRARNGELTRSAARLENEVHDLRQANQRLRHFVHAVSHDLAQPLSVLGGYLELLDDDQLVLDERARRWVELARRGHVAIVQSVDALLRHAASDRLPVRREPLADIVAGVLDAIAPTLDAAGATIVVEPGVHVDVDPELFAGALQNVLLNSCRYRRRDRPLRIEITHEIAGDVDLVRVVDNGAGFVTGEHESVFGHGVRGSAAADRPGTGAGLATVRSIVADLGGRVWAEDAPGGGAVIAIALPRSTAVT